MGGINGDFTTADYSSFNSTFLNDTLDGGDVGREATTFMSGTNDYCGTSLKFFEKSYKGFHGYTSLIVCLFGVQANILNLIVLTRKEMINPTNAILTGLALADLLNMVEYIPYALTYILPRSNTYSWALYILIHSNFSQVCHTISIWLTVTLAVWRYIMVAMHTRCRTLCSMERAIWAIASAYISSPILCIPIYLSFSVTRVPPMSSSVGSGPSSVNSTDAPLPEANYTMITTTESPGGEKNGTGGGSRNGSSAYRVNLSDLAQEHPALMTANFWLYSVVIKIIPCVVLTVVSLRLINSLMEAKKRKEKLLAKRTVQVPTVSGGGHTVAPAGNNTNARAAAGDHESGGSDRTTRMLLAILLLFLITEFPQGLLGLLSGVLGDSFFTTCYIPLADLMDFVALLNSAINFILYCVMSKKFRDTFVQVFHLQALMKLCRLAK